MAPIRATITGTVVKVQVGAGDAVAPGDEVLLIESMKMEIPIVVEVAGRVEEVMCEEGETVQEGEILIRLA